MVERPRVVIGAASRFWAYHQARGAEKAGLLQRLIIGQPDPRETGIPPHKIVALPWPARAAYLIYHLPFRSSQVWSYYVGDNWFDRWAGRYVRDADIYHVYNHHGLHSLRVAQRAGAITVIERASAHPRFVDHLLRDEYQKYNLPYTAVTPAVLDKHLREYQETDYIFVASEFIRRTMIAEGVPPEKLRCLPLGFAPEQFSPGPKADDIFRVVFVGAISLQKGVQYLLEGFRLADLPPARAELVLVGHAFKDAQSFLPHYSGLYRQVKFLPHSALPDLYRSGSVFVLPSVQDGFGMVVYEAAACGLPAIVTENVGAAIQDGEQGFVVPIRNPAALAEKLIYFYTHPTERQGMGAAASQYARRFTWDNYHRAQAQTYREIWKR
jgi:glycosyltransferase involved in cell wall biosynthesis